MDHPGHYDDMITMALAKMGIVSKTVLAKCFAVGAANFFATELITRDTALAIALTALSTVATAYFSARPKAIAAQAAVWAARRTAEDTSNTAVFERQNALHAEALGMKDAVIMGIKAENALVRISKHNCIAFIDDAEARIREYEILMRETGIDYNAVFDGRKYHFVDKRKIFVEEDAALAEMAKAAIDKAKDLI